MPKNTAQRRIDSRRQNRATTISGVTLSGSPGSGGSAALAGDGLTYDGVALNVGAGTLLTVAADDIGITAGSTYQYIGTGSGTAAAWQNLSGLAGAGLTHTTGVLAVGAGNGITVNADDVALTTPGTLTVSTTNSATGGHTHAITSSSNPGANARLLASTASGGLTLQSLAVQGSVDVTNGGDLTVAGSGSYAGQSVLFADSSGGNVGILCAPDAQFALDINGPARATYWIGPHAIQLKNVLLLSHFDGRQPFATNYYGEPNGHMGQVATVSGSVVYREGKFGTKALQTGAAATNLCTNPSFETNTTSWTWNDSNASGSMARSQYAVHTGSYALQVYSANAGEDDYASFTLSGVAASTAYTISAYVYALTFTAGAASNRGIYAYDSANAGATAQTATLTAATDGWVRLSVTVTTTATPGSIVVRLYAPQGTTYWDAVQIEQAGGATGYADGSLPGHTWSGTAHASTSTRTATAYVTYPTSGNIDPTRGTIMAWVYPFSAFGAVTIFRITGSTAGNIILRTNGYTLEAFWGTSSISAAAALTPGAWMHVAMSYDGTTLRLYVNGAQVASGAVSGFSGLPASMFVGIADGVNGPFNGLIDDLVITADTKAAGDILSVYQSNAPVFAESSRFSFRATPQGLVWADDEGLWMRNSTGGTVLGAYGGAATKSWGGLTLSPSDVVIGDSSRGSYAWWDDSAGAFAIGRSGTDRISLSSAGVLSIKDSGGAAVFTFDASAGAEFTKPLTLGSSGGIYQGTYQSGHSGDWNYPDTGLKIWRDSGVGRIGGYNGGDLQWTADTTGRLYAGYMSSSSTTNKYALRIARDGVRLTAEASSSYAVSTSASAIRWIYNATGDVDGTIGSGETYSAIYSYNNTSSNVIYTGVMNFVGSAVYTTKDSIVYLSAQHYTGTVTKGVDLLLAVTKSTGATYAYCNADEFQLTKALKMSEMTAPSAPSANGVFIYAEDNGSGKTRLMAKFSSGAAQQIAIQP